VGPYQYAIRWPWIRNALSAAIRDEDAVLMRVPSFLANCIEPILRKRGHPYGLEVVGDPYDGLGPGAIRHLLRPLLRIIIPRRLRQQCSHAAGVAYVTRSALQQRYPGGGLMVGVSDAAIPRHAFADSTFTTHYPSLSLATAQLAIPKVAVHQGPLRLICVGSLEQFYKGHDVLLRAVSSCISQGVDLRLCLVGDGRIRPKIEALAKELGIDHYCEFAGHLTQSSAVLAELDKSDIFVLASRTEGLPRAVIEAMARGLPCISTRVGGIPELLAEEDLVPPDDSMALAVKIKEVAESPERRGRMSSRNVAEAREYLEETLQTRRTEFYRHIQRTSRIRRMNLDSGDRI
jgi:glycosyltransferase involved in cell wall biosynthesis